MKASLAILFLFSAACAVRTGTSSGPAPPLQEFVNRAKAYAELQKNLRSKLPALKDKDKPEQIVEHEKLLQTAVRQERKTAKQGDIFIPAVRPYLVQLVKAELSGPTNKSAREAVKESNPRGGEEPSPKPVPLAVNAVYLKEAPLTTVPPSLLLKLPKLPEELEFRFVGKALIMRYSCESDRGLLTGGGSMMRAVLWLFAPLLCGQSLQVPNKPDSFKFAVFGDIGTGGREEYEVAVKAAEYRRLFPFTHAILLGDNMYGGERASDFESKFARPFRPLLDVGVKFYAALGNHDDTNQIHYKLFNMNGERFYTFKPKNGIRFFALDSNYLDRRQFEWLEKELASSGSDWKICFFHHPLYSSGERHGPHEELRTILEPILLKYGVTVVFTGHEHFYERVKPQKGIQHFILGNSAKLRKGNINRASDLTVAGFDTDRTFMLVEIEGDTMHFQAISRTGKTVDNGMLKQLRFNNSPAKDSPAGVSKRGN